jgi:hypothetical protein
VLAIKRCIGIGQHWVSQKKPVGFPFHNKFLKRRQSSYRTRWNRDPVSSDQQFSLDSGYPPATDSGMTGSVIKLRRSSFTMTC